MHVTLYPVSAFDLNSTTNLMVSSGEKLDLALSLFENGCMSYVNKGIAMDLTDLVDQYGQDIVNAEGVAMSGGYYNGTLYAVPSEEKMGRVKAFVCRKDILDKYGIEYDENTSTPWMSFRYFRNRSGGRGQRLLLHRSNAV